MATPKQVSNEFGIEFVDEADVPEAPRQNDRNPALWKAVLVVLRQSPGNWAKVREYDKPASAGAVTSNINGGRNKRFPSDQWEARSSKGETGSVLFMRYVGPKMSAQEAEAAENSSESDV